MPLIGTPCPPIIPRKTCKFFGHLSIDRIKINQREMVYIPSLSLLSMYVCMYACDMLVKWWFVGLILQEEAVSTSHFSQPNTIEYDMAMEWFLMQSKSKKWWEMIYKVRICHHIYTYTVYHLFYIFVHWTLCRLIHFSFKEMR